MGVSVLRMVCRISIDHAHRWTLCLCVSLATVDDESAKLWLNFVIIIYSLCNLREPQLSARRAPLSIILTPLKNLTLLLRLLLANLNY